MALVIGAIVILVIGIVMILSCMLTDTNPLHYVIEHEKPFKDCEDCKGTGKIEVVYEGSGEFIKCPCTIVLTHYGRGLSI